MNTLHKLFKFTFIFSAVITLWTSFILLSNSTFNLEIKHLITKMYLNQKNFIINVKELSLLLVKDANERFSDKDSGMILLNNAKEDE